MESSLTTDLKKYHNANTFVQDQDPEFQCKDCSDQKISFNCERELEIHKVKYHYTIVNPRVCGACGKNFISISFLRWHIAIYHLRIKQ